MEKSSDKVICPCTIEKTDDGFTAVLFGLFSATGKTELAALKALEKMLEEFDLSK